MQKYELLYIVPAQYTDDEVTTIQGKIAELIEKIGGKIVRNENLGKIKLAYPIKKARHGSYVLVYFDADTQELTELDRLLRLSNEIIRYTVVERPEGADAAKFEISSYVAPLSEEAKRSSSKFKSDRPRKERENRDADEEQKQLPPPPPAEKTTEESMMTMQELDQQLDKILEGDIGDNI